MKPATKILRVVAPENGGPRKRSVLEGLARAYGATAELVDEMIRGGQLHKHGDRRGSTWGLPPAGRQRGFAVLTQLIMGGVVLALASGAFAYYNHVVSERARLEIELSDAIKAEQQQAAVTEGLRADMKARDALLRKRELARQQLETERGILDAALEEIRKQPEVAAWLAGAIPGAVVERVRGNPPAQADQRGEAVPAAKPRPADAGAAVPR